MGNIIQFFNSYFALSMTNHGYTKTHTESTETTTDRHEGNKKPYKTTIPLPTGEVNIMKKGEYVTITGFSNGKLHKVSDKIMIHVTGNTVARVDHKQDPNNFEHTIVEIYFEEDK